MSMWPSVSRSMKPAITPPISRHPAGFVGPALRRRASSGRSSGAQADELGGGVVGLQQPRCARSGGRWLQQGGRVVQPDTVARLIRRSATAGARRTEAPLSPRRTAVGLAASNGHPGACSTSGASNRKRRPAALSPPAAAPAWRARPSSGWTGRTCGDPPASLRSARRSPSRSARWITVTPPPGLDGPAAGTPSTPPGRRRPATPLAARARGRGGRRGRRRTAGWRRRGRKELEAGQQVEAAVRDVCLPRSATRSSTLHCRLTLARASAAADGCRARRPTKRLPLRSAPPPAGARRPRAAARLERALSGLRGRARRPAAPRPALRDSPSAPVCNVHPTAKQPVRGQLRRFRVGGRRGGIRSWKGCSRARRLDPDRAA